MERDKPSLGEKIDTLARWTSAPVGFVQKVRDLFASKGIDLDATAEPFEAILERVFERQAEAQRNVENAQRNLGSLRGRIAEMNGAFQDQVEKLRGMRQVLEQQVRRLAAVAPRGMEVPERVRFVRGEWELTIVPGPDEEQ